MAVVLKLRHVFIPVTMAEMDLRESLRLWAGNFQSHQLLMAVCPDGCNEQRANK